MVHLLAVACAAPATLTPQAFSTPRPTALTAAWDGLEAIGTAGDDARNGDESGARQLYLLPSFMSADEVQRVVTIMDETAPTFDTGLDTVDDAATYLLRVVDEGEVASPAVFDAIAPMLRERLEPYVRAKFDCPGACVADALIRRYLPSERRRLEAHFDTSSFATVIISLNDASDYVGGLYVQSVPGVASRRFVPLEAGDGLVHQFDTMHGVQVPEGSRLSLVVWFSDSEASLRAGNCAPWVERAARDGNAEAMFVLGGCCYRGEHGYAYEYRRLHSPAVSARCRVNRARPSSPA